MPLWGTYGAIGMVVLRFLDWAMKNQYLTPILRQKLGGGDKIIFVSMSFVP